MAKSKKQPQAQILSPENYIRQKARKLPIHECLINSNWKEIGVAQILISRIHANGNKTFGTFMIDLLCMGVRDTFYMFSTSNTEYDRVLYNMNRRYDMIKVAYNLVHNIIFSGKEYGFELGFVQHKDFASITEYILEEDTDDVELMEIECGRNGKPMYIQGISATNEEAEKVINQLEKVVGKGNFEVVMEADMDHIKLRKTIKETE